MEQADLIHVSKYDEVYIRIACANSIKRELSDFFSFYSEGYQFNPKFKARVWDGKIRLFDPRTSLLYAGLLEKLQEFAEVREYTVKVDSSVLEYNELTESEILEFCKEIKTTLNPRDYQIGYVLNALNKNRSISLSPTSSGKSFIQYIIQQYYYAQLEAKTLLVVPTVNLVLQMQGDFISYGCDPEQIHIIKSGQSKTTDKPITITTWQSLLSQDKDWFAQFDVVLGDEAHLFTAKSLITIMESLTNAKFRHGFSGTIPKKSKVNTMVLEGLFGKIISIVKTADLIKDETVASFKIKALILKYSDEQKKAYREAIKDVSKKEKFQAERTFLFTNEKRNLFIRNLVWSLKDQNNLILFDKVEEHGKPLEKLLRKDGRMLHLIYGKVKGDVREEIRQMIEADPIKQHDILASFQTLSTGMSLKRLDNIIFASGSKSEVRVFQSIGRSLRRGNGADEAVLYDIADDLSTKSSKNYFLEHFMERIAFYSEQKLDFKLYNIDLG